MNQRWLGRPMRYQQIPPALSLGSVRQAAVFLTGAPGSEDWAGNSLKVTVMSLGWMPRPSRVLSLPGVFPDAKDPSSRVRP
jgi:hypothetical protein